MNRDLLNFLAGAGIVSHDAGGAEILSSIMGRSELGIPFLVQGPAVSIFSRKLSTRQFRHRVFDADHLSQEAQHLLSSASWQSDLEWRTMTTFERVGKSTAVLFDHWVNFRERLTRHGITRIPDAIFVTDEHALQKAQTDFPMTPIQLIDNPYLDDILLEADAVSGAYWRPYTALFLGENISEHAASESGPSVPANFNEVDAFLYFLTFAGKWDPPIERIVIRPHPSESPDKYLRVAHDFEIPVVISDSRSLARDIHDSDVVVGCESMAMVVAMSVGKPVWCCIPPWGRASSLPFREIRNLKDH